MRTLDYSVLDVFAEKALEGNALAVFHNAHGLSDQEMQALARETNLSETTFVLPAEDPEQDRQEGVRVRIFTTQEELPFAGHPTLGTATWLRLHHPALQDAPTVTLRCTVGPVPVRFSAPMDGKPGLYGSMRQRDPKFGPVYDIAEIAPVLGLTEGDLLPGYQPQTVSTGNAFCIVALRSVEVLQRLAIPAREATAWLRANGSRWFYCIAPVGGDTWRARMQWESGEDPATGSAAGPCAAWLVQNGLAASEAPVTLLQGVEIQRPSRLDVQARDAGGGMVTDVFVAGRTIPVASGQFFLPSQP